MGVTMILLGLLYVAFAAVLIVLPKSFALIVVILGGLLAALYWFSDKVALAALHGHVVTEAGFPDLHAVVNRLCASAKRQRKAHGYGAARRCRVSGRG
jgi:heat shock protein HtpX